MKKLLPASFAFVFLLVSSKAAPQTAAPPGSVTDLPTISVAASKSPPMWLFSKGRKKLVLNLAGVPYIDSAGLGEIVRTYTTVSRQGDSLKLLSLTKRITDLLSITKLLTVFETYDNEADAVRSFTSSANV